MKTTIAIIALALMQAAFFAITYSHNPTTDEFAAYYFAWVLVPATVAAITFKPRFHFVAAISNSIVASLLFDYLLLQHGYFWPDRPKESSGLAVGYIVIGVMLAFVVAGFVHATIERIRRSAASDRMSQALLAIRKGLVFSMVCAAVAFPVCTMFDPVRVGVAPGSTYVFPTIVASCFIVFGTIIALVVGLTFDPTKHQSR